MMNKKTAAWRALCLLGAWMLVPATLRAQIATADIVGRVTDSSAAVLVGVNINVENVATGAVRSTQTDSTGNYVVTLLPIGRYSIRAEQRGFRTSTVPEITLSAGDRARVDISLEVGALEQTVEVQARPPELQSDSSTLGSLINAQAVQDLPLNGRNFIRLAQLAAGANESVQNALSSGNRPDDRRRTSAISVNGQRDFVNNFLVDGMDNNERAIGTMILRPSMDALAEFRVQTNLYSAEVGRTAGGVVNLITKSGTNEFHGSAFEFLRNDKLDAKNFFAPTGPSPQLRQNQFGGSLGGPIRRNKTFFFGDYEGLRIRQGLVFVNTVPTEAMKAGNFAGVNPIFDPLSLRADPITPGRSLRDRFPGDQIPANRMDAPARRIAALYPTPQSVSLANNNTNTGARRQRDDTFDTRVDHRFSDQNTFFTRYSFNDTTTYTPPQLPRVGDIEAGGETGSFAGTALQRSQGLLLDDVHVFRPNLLMELKAGYVRYEVLSLPVNYGKNISQQFGIPNANFDDVSSGLVPITIAGFRGIGDANFIPIFAKNNIFEYNGSLTYIHGGHNLKFGADLRRRQVTFYSSNQPRGTYNFDGNFSNDPTGETVGSGNSFASFLLGYPQSTTRGYLLVWPGKRTWEYSWYIQDDWRVSPRLTLNIGLRYDVFTPYTEVANRISNVDPYAGKILIAGRDGVSDTAGVMTDRNNFAPRFGFAFTLTPKTVLRGGYGISFFPANFGANSLHRNPPFVALYSVVTTPVDLANRISDGFPLPLPVDPRNPVGNVASFANDFVASYAQQYNVTLQRALPGVVVSAGYVGALGRKQVADYNMNLAPPGPGPINPRRPFYNVFPGIVGITRESSDTTSNYHALQLMAERRFSAGLTLMSNYTLGHAIDDTQTVAGGKPGNGPYPQMPGNRRLERANSDIDIRHRFVVMTNYELPFARSAKGTAGLLAKGWQVNAVLVAQTGTTFSVSNAAARANTGGGDRPNRISDGALPSGERSIQRWFDTSAFAAQPLYQIGTAARNPLYGPPLRQFDLSLFKEFPIREPMRLQFRAETFNLTNTPNFGIPNAALGTAVFGTISDTGNFIPRQLQFALKLLF
jgi:outer membrane receptor protein involved in Fe transport